MVSGHWNQADIIKPSLIRFSDSFFFSFRAQKENSMLAIRSGLTLYFLDVLVYLL